MSTQLTDALRGEHTELLRLLRGAVGPDGAVNLPTFDDFRHRVLRHIVVEERVLLPALRARLHTELVFQNGLRKDHAAVVAHCLPMPDVDWVSDLADLLAYHQSLEEAPDGLYALYDEHVGEDAGVAAAIAGLKLIELPPFQSGPSLGWRLRDILREAGLSP